MSEQISSHVRDIQRGAESVLSLLKEGKKDENKVLEEIAKAQSGVKELQSCVDDVAVMVRANDEEHRAILDLLRDALGSLKSSVAQIDTFARNELKSLGNDNMSQLEATVALLDDFGRGVIETHQALSEVDYSTALRTKATIPVSVITGFLGSGKTTLLNYILTQEHGKRIAVIENEYGEIGIDDELIKDKFSDTEEIFQMNNGCICCTVRGDLIRTLGNLMEQSDKFDYILIETTGLADPAPIAQTFFTVPELGVKLRMDGIITVCDAKHLIQHLDEEKEDGAVNESIEQVAFADRILLNKIDLVTEAEVDEIHERIREINKLAEIVPTQRSVIELDRILNIRAFDLEKITDLDPDFLLAKKEEAEHKHHEHKHEHGEHKEHDEKKVKAKMGKGKHKHDVQVGSVGFAFEGELDMEKLNQWMGGLLRSRGPDIYRMKGVLAVQGMDNRFVFQGVHMIFDGNPGSPWRDDESRVNKIVFIGKNLNREELQDGMKSCLAN